MDLLDLQLQDIETRLERAKDSSKTHICYTLALRLQIVESVRGMMYQYATHMAELLDYFLEQICEDPVINDAELDQLMEGLLSSERLVQN